MDRGDFLSMTGGTRSVPARRSRPTHLPSRRQPTASPWRLVGQMPPDEEAGKARPLVAPPARVGAWPSNRPPAHLARAPRSLPPSHGSSGLLPLPRACRVAWPSAPPEGARMRARRDRSQAHKAFRSRERRNPVVPRQPDHRAERALRERAQNRLLHRYGKVRRAPARAALQAKARPSALHRARPAKEGAGNVPLPQGRHR